MEVSTEKCVSPRQAATVIHGWLLPHLKHMISFNTFEEVVARAMKAPLSTDEGGCVTKRFVIFTTPGRAPEKKGGWLSDENLTDFLRDVVLHDGWRPGFQATVLELTWDNDLWASSACEYLSLHDDAIGPRRARKAWVEAREKHERIYGSAPASKRGDEIAFFRRLTTPARSDTKEAAA